jgi:hypothetical protein
VTTDWIFGWWNLVYLAPFLLAGIYLGVYAFSGATFGDFDLDADAGGDVDADVDVDADAGGDADADADGDGGHDHPVLAALSWLGVGRVPLSIVLMVLMLTWGCIGLAVNLLMRDVVVEPPFAVIFSLPMAMGGSLMLTGAIAHLVLHFIPPPEKLGRRRHALLGCSGEAIFPVDASGGSVSVRDEDGNLFHVACRVAEGTKAIDKGSRVRLVAYRAADNVFVVELIHPADAVAGSGAAAAATI